MRTCEELHSPSLLTLAIRRAIADTLIANIKHKKAIKALAASLLRMMPKGTAPLFNLKGVTTS